MFTQVLLSERRKCEVYSGGQLTVSKLLHKYKLQRVNFTPVYFPQPTLLQTSLLHVVELVLLMVRFVFLLVWISTEIISL